MFSVYQHSLTKKGISICHSNSFDFLELYKLGNSSGRSLRVSFLESGDVLSVAESLIPQCDQVDIAVAFLKDSGYQSIRNEIVDFLRSGNKIRLIVGLSGFCITDPSPLEDLLEVRDTLKRKNSLRLKYYSNTQFHPKLLIFRQNDIGVNFT